MNIGDKMKFTGDSNIFHTKGRIYSVNGYGRDHDNNVDIIFISSNIKDGQGKYFRVSTTYFGENFKEQVGEEEKHEIG